MPPIPEPFKPKISPSAIDKLGERLRLDEIKAGDLDVLDAYQAAYDNLLINLSHTVDKLLSNSSIRFVLAGRLKRPKSTIRKLKRDENKNMGLSKMGDVLGLRVIVATVADQERVLKILKQHFQISEIKDYRETGQIYRSLHVLVREERLIEIQLRTIPQHVWAVESESFGERVKEGTLLGDEKEYLTSLSDACVKLDKGHQLTEEDYRSTPLMKGRAPFSGLYSRLREMFGNVVWETSAAGRSSVMVYDNEIRELLQGKDLYAQEQREAAIKQFQDNTRKVSEVRFESLILNAPSLAILKITHPRFFL
jgi:ppGpp synthetase/RelA/SpoT-type nucleotidyltranferase